MSGFLEVIEKQNKRINDLNNSVYELQNEIAILKESKYEVYYQRFLEKTLGASHKVTKYGITDITTDYHHIEIKQWRHFKNCLGQLKSYNHGDNKELIAAFYGEYKHKENIIELFHSHSINVWELNDTPSGISISKHELKVEEIESSKTDFYKWLDQNVVRKEDSVLNLKDIIYLFLGKTVPSRISSPYKNQIEKWIKNNHVKINYKYRDTSYKGIKVKGWVGFNII